MSEHTKPAGSDTGSLIHFSRFPVCNLHIGVKIQISPKSSVPSSSSRSVSPLRSPPRGSCVLHPSFLARQAPNATAAPLPPKVSLFTSSMDASTPSLLLLLLLLRLPPSPLRGILGGINSPPNSPPFLPSPSPKI